MIRPYVPNDMPALLNLIRLNTPRYFNPQEEKDFKHYLKHSIEQYFVLEEQKMIVGCGGINYEDDGKTGIISWDIIHPEYHKKGLGSKLLQHRIMLLKSNKKIAKIRVRTAQFTNFYYKKFGFKTISVVKNYWAPGFDLYDMELKIDN